MKDQHNRQNTDLYHSSVVTSSSIYILLCIHCDEINNKMMHSNRRKIDL